MGPFAALEAALRLVATDYAETDLLRMRHQIIASTPSLSTPLREAAAAAGDRGHRRAASVRQARG